jgi:hypothetical protein
VGLSEVTDELARKQTFSLLHEEVKFRKLFMIILHKDLKNFCSFFD